jgi:hypothetical protein
LDKRRGYEGGKWEAVTVHDLSFSVKAEAGEVTDRSRPATSRGLA